MQVSPAGNPARQPRGRQSAAGDPVRELEAAPADEREHTDRAPEHLGMPRGTVEGNAAGEEGDALGLLARCARVFVCERGATGRVHVAVGRLAPD
jgi:hypothetical protein